MANTISQYVPVQTGATEYVRSNFPLILTFLKAYYEWLEQSDQVVSGIYSLRDERNVDTCSTAFLDYFHKKYLNGLPVSMLVDKRLFIKHVLDFFNIKGTEKAFKILFRILYNASVEFYYPKLDILKVSDGKWSVSKIIRTTATADATNFPGRLITGVTSGATAAIESVRAITVDATEARELGVSDVVGTFTIGETVQIDLPDGTTAEETVYGVVTGANFTAVGLGYKQGDILPVSGANATGSVQVETVEGEEYGYVCGAASNTITLAPRASSSDDYYNTLTITITDGTGIGQERTISDYNGTTKVATISSVWTTQPDTTSKYRVSLGKIKTVSVKEFGLDYSESASLDCSGSGDGQAVGTITVGALGTAAGSFKNTDGFLSDNKYLQDSYYYQDFSYVLKSTIPISTYRNIIKQVLHPASFKLFGITTEGEPTSGRPTSEEVPEV